MTSNVKPHQPTLMMLLVVYAIWISAIVAIITIPSLSFLGILAVALVLFVWLPYWARVNWSSVADDLPATYATIAVSLILIVLLGFVFRYNASSIGYRLVQSGWLEPREIGQWNWIEFVIQMGVFYSIYPAWRWFRRAFARTPSKAPETATPKVNP